MNDRLYSRREMFKSYAVVLNLNGGEDVLDCLESLKNERVNILVVDNGSTDGSVVAIRKKFSKVKIIENKKNLGFTAGNNIGIRYALKQGAEAVLLLNHDTIVEKGFLELLLKNPADIVGPVIKFKRKGKLIYDHGGKVDRIFGRNYHLESGKRGKTRKIDYVSGCAMLIRRPVFEKIGLLDEIYFIFYEDADFCLKARRAGFKIAVESKSLIFHKLSEGKKKPWRMHFHLLKSNFIFINRYVPLYRRKLAYDYLLLLSFKVIWNQLT